MYFKLYFVVISVCLSVQCLRVKRVVGGMVVECGAQPRVVSLRKTNDMKHICGATILSPEVAVTAAHCVQKNALYYLQLNNFCTDIYPLALVLAVVKHELYDKYSRAHDIALLQIKLDVNDTSWLNNSILPRSSFGVSGECTIYGYGYEHVHSTESSDTLRAGMVNIISLDDCTERLSLMAPEHDSGLMCAMGEGVDTCQGDSGGPLFRGSSLEGISSHGVSCATPGVPGVYTSIGAHLSWIRRTMQIMKMY